MSILGPTQSRVSPSILEYAKKVRARHKHILVCPVVLCSTGVYELFSCCTCIVFLLYINRIGALYVLHTSCIRDQGRLSLNARAQIKSSEDDVSSESGLVVHIPHCCGGPDSLLVKFSPESPEFSFWLILTPHGEVRGFRWFRILNAISPNFHHTRTQSELRVAS